MVFLQTAKDKIPIRRISDLVTLVSWCVWFTNWPPVGYLMLPIELHQLILSRGNSTNVSLRKQTYRWSSNAVVTGQVKLNYLGGSGPWWTFIFQDIKKFFDIDHRSGENHSIMKKTFWYLLFMVIFLPTLGFTTASAGIEFIFGNRNETLRFGVKSANWNF